MKRTYASYFSLGILVFVLGVFSPFKPKYANWEEDLALPPADIKISEFEPNPAGSDPSTQFVELTGQPSASFDLWLVSIENDGYNGDVDRFTNVTGSFDLNGFASVSISDLENPSFTLILTSSFSGSGSTDIDPGNDGNLDLSAFGDILDAVGVSDGTADNTLLYGASLGGANLVNLGESTNSGEPFLVFRDGTTGDWYSSFETNPSNPVLVYRANGNSLSTNVDDWDIDPRTNTFGTMNPSYSPAPCIQATANINEFHYDNDGTDQGEFVEIYVADPQPTNLSLYSLIPYNGNDGDNYGAIHDLSTFDAVSVTEGVYYHKLISGIQNGPDGFALTGPCGVIEFISYEGSFMATEGPANGLTSTDVGVSEPGDAPVGSALQLLECGWTYTPGLNTKGGENVVAPILLSRTPADDAANIAVDANLVLEFCQDIQTDVCRDLMVQIIRTCDGAVFEAYNLCTDANATISGGTLTLDPAGNLDPGTEYHVLITSDALKNANDQNWAGFSDPAEWNFSTAGDGPITVVSLTPADTGFLHTPVPDPFELTVEFSKSPEFAEDYLICELFAEGTSLGMQTVSGAFAPTGNSHTVDLSALFPSNFPAADSLRVRLLADGISNGGVHLDGNGDGCPGDDLAFGYRIPKPIVIPYMAMFDECDLIGDWQGVSADADTDNTWSCSENTGTFLVNAFGDTAPADDWLISPQFDLDASPGEVLSFDLYTRFSDVGFPQIKLWYTNGFTGNPSDAANNWVDISDRVAFPEASSGAYTNSGLIDISDISGENVQFAFQYTSSGTSTGNTTEWRLDNFFIKELAAVITVDPFVCIGDEVEFSIRFFGGMAPYEFTYLDEVYSFTEKDNTLSLPLPAGDFTVPLLPLNFSFENIQDANSASLPDEIREITPVDCEIQNDFKPEDPCACNNDQSGNGAQDGSFRETVSVKTTLPNQIWTVTSIEPLSRNSDFAPAKIPPAGHAVAITEFLNDPTGSDAGREFIELFNYGPQPVELAGWKIKDEDGEEVVLPSYTLAPNAYVVLVNGANSLSAADAEDQFESEWFGGVDEPEVIGMEDVFFTNDGDELILEDDTGMVVWSLAYPGNDDEGRATHLANVELSLIPMAFGSQSIPGVNFFGDDLNIPDFPGYEANSSTADPDQSTSTNGDIGSPGTGPYVAVTNQDMPIQMGQRLLYDTENSRHILPFLHFDDQGYSLTIEGPNLPGSPNNRELSISNVCAYPVIAFDPAVLSGYPQNGGRVSLALAEEMDFPADPDHPAEILFNGNSALDFEPVNLSPDAYPLSAFFQADSVSATGGTLEDPANPGCQTFLEQEVVIRSTSLTRDSCICFDQVNVTLEEDCGYALQVSQLSMDDCIGARLIVNDENPANDNVIDCPGTFSYGLFDGNNQLFCWGTVTAEDKTGPVVDTIITTVESFDCAQIDRVLNVPTSTDSVIFDFFGNRFENPYYLGEVLFGDGCRDCGCGVSSSFVDAVEYFSCEQIEESGLYGRMIRTWKATDCEGNQTVYQQIFDLTVPRVEDLFGRADLTINTCTPEEVNIPGTSPFWLNEFGGVTFANQVCNYALSVEEGPRFEVCNGRGFKFERYYKLLDWCQGTSEYVDTVLIKVGDFEAPAFGPQADTITGYRNVLDSLNGTSVPGTAVDIDSLRRRYDVQLESLPVLSTGPLDCSAAMFLSLESIRGLFGENIIQDNCTEDPEISVTIYSYLPEKIYGIPTGDTSWVRGNYPMVNGMATGIPCGLHAMVVEVNDECYNTGKMITYFLVRDQVAPVMKCDDALKVTLTNGDPKSVEAGLDGLAAYARVAAAEVDEGSFDNCSALNFAVRRSIPADAFDPAFWVARGYDNDRPGPGIEPDGTITEDDFKINPATGEPSYWEFDADQEVWFTPYEEYVEFFCFDAGAYRTIELLGADTKKAIIPGESVGHSNSNTCWQDILIEDGTNVWTAWNDNEEIPCTDPRLEIIDDALEAAAFPLTFSNADGASGFAADIIGAFGAPEVIGTLCRDYSWTIELEDYRDHCGFNYFELEYTLTTEGKNPRSLRATKRVDIYAVHNYWIKFPADAYADCADPEVPGVETSDPEDNACDLLAISHEDEQFLATSDTSCYKIFRTWKVINWCEYDGETLPVIVGRDWDYWNGQDFDLWDIGGAQPYSPRRHENVVSRGMTVDGDDKPGDEDLYVIVDRSDDDHSLDVVYYDRDNDPFNNIPDDDRNFNRNDLGDVITEGYWWKVVSGAGRFATRYDADGDVISSGDESYYTGGMRLGYDDNGDPEFGPSSAWGDQSGDSPGSSQNAYVVGTPAQDDDDYRYGSFGFWQYTQHVVVYDESVPVATIDAPDAGALSNFDCAAETSFTVTISDACSVADVNVEVAVDGIPEIPVSQETNAAGEVVVTVSKRRALGTYKIDIEVTDGCGNFTTETAEFEVFDDKAPAPICHDDLIVELMPAEDTESPGMAIIWASDLVASPIGDCTGQDAAEVNVGNGYSQPMVTKFSINRLDSAVVEDQTSLELSCADGENMVDVELHAWDGAGNHDFCVTTILVQDNADACGDGAPGDGAVDGSISTEDSAPVAGVEVLLSGQGSQLFMTDETGEFGFDRLQEGGDYTITPLKDTDHRNGVSTFDVVLTQKHILGQPLDSPYKVIAADVNKSGAVTTLDVIQMRKVILNIDTEFKNNTSWRFVDEEYTFDTGRDPLEMPFPEIKNINNLERGDYANFVAIKTGDVNNSAEVAPRAKTGTLAIEVPEMELKAGNEYTIPFTADLQEVLGYQFTLNVEPAKAQIVDIVYGAANAEHFGVFQQEGTITTSFNQDGLGENTELFGLVIRATADAQLSDVLRIGSRYTAAEAYSNSDEHLDVALNFSGTTATAAEFALFQNTPNPFQSETLIGFHLPEAGEATLTIQDVAGRTVKLIEGDFIKGYNQVTLKSNELPGVGVFFYTLMAGEYSATKKLMIIDEVNR